MSRKNLRKNLGRIVIALINGSYLKSSVFKKQIPFIFYLVGLFSLLIYSQNDIERKAREIIKLNREIKNLQFHYVTTKTKLMHQIQPSEVAKKLEAYNIKESLVPPTVIKIEKERN